MPLLIHRTMLPAALLFASAACAPDPQAAPPRSDGAGSTTSASAPALVPTPAEATDATPPDLSGWNQAESTSGALTVAWRPADGATVPRNRETSLDVVVLQDGAPREGLRLQVSGFMPAHDHGLVQIPVIEELGSGRYRVDGLLLHMRGHWQLRFALSARGLMEAATFELEL